MVGGVGVWPHPLPLTTSLDIFVFLFPLPVAITRTKGYRISRHRRDPANPLCPPWSIATTAIQCNVGTARSCVCVFFFRQPISLCGETFASCCYRRVINEVGWLDLCEVLKTNPDRGTHSPIDLPSLTGPSEQILPPPSPPSLTQSQCTKYFPRLNSL